MRERQVSASIGDRGGRDLSQKPVGQRAITTKRGSGRPRRCSAPMTANTGPPISSFNATIASVKSRRGIGLHAGVTAVHPEIDDDDRDDHAEDRREGAADHGHPRTRFRPTARRLGRPERTGGARHRLRDDRSRRRRGPGLAFEHVVADEVVVAPDLDVLQHRVGRGDFLELLGLRSRRTRVGMQLLGEQAVRAADVCVGRRRARRRGSRRSRPPPSPWCACRPCTGNDTEPPRTSSRQGRTPALSPSARPRSA